MKIIDRRDHLPAQFVRKHQRTVIALVAGRYDIVFDETGYGETPNLEGKRKIAIMDLKANDTIRSTTGATRVFLSVESAIDTAKRLDRQPQLMWRA